MDEENGNGQAAAPAEPAAHTGESLILMKNIWKP